MAQTTRCLSTPPGDPVERAFKAYFRRFPEGAQPCRYSGIKEHNGEQFVVLDNVNGILAVYLIKPNGKLQFLEE